MPRSKEFSEALRKKVVEAHEAGKGYKSISKVFALHSSTVRKIIYKWKEFNTTATRPRSGRPTKLDAALRRVRSGAENENDQTEDGCWVDGSSEGEATTRVSVPEDLSGRIENDVSGSAEGEESARVSGTDTSLELTNGSVHVGIENNILASMNPARPNDSAVPKTAKRIRGRKEKMKSLKLMHNHVLTSPLTHSSSQAPIIPQYDAPTSGPTEHYVEVMMCCEICGACFPTEADLEVHQAQHLAKMMHECEECGKVFQSAGGLKTHKKRKHGR